MEPYVNTGRKDYLQEQRRQRKLRDVQDNIARRGIYNPTSNFNRWKERRSEGELGTQSKWNIRKQKKQAILNQKFQSKSKQTLLTNQPVKSKGGGKSGGGGGGKWGWFNRMRHSPWNLLRNDKSY